VLVTWGRFSCKIFCKMTRSKFRCYLVISVRSWSN
jgi:hypothetical protein